MKTLCKSQSVLPIAGITGFLLCTAFSILVRKVAVRGGPLQGQGRARTRRSEVARGDHLVPHRVVDQNPTHDQGHDLDPNLDLDLREPAPVLGHHLGQGHTLGALQDQEVGQEIDIEGQDQNHPRLKVNGISPSLAQDQNLQWEGQGDLNQDLGQGHIQGEDIQAQGE